MAEFPFLVVVGWGAVADLFFYFCTFVFTALLLSFLLYPVALTCGLFIYRDGVRACEIHFRFSRTSIFTFHNYFFEFYPRISAISFRNFCFYFRNSGIEKDLIFVRAPLCAGRLGTLKLANRKVGDTLLCLKALLN